MKSKTVKHADDKKAAPNGNVTVPDKARLLEIGAKPWESDELAYAGVALNAVADNTTTALDFSKALFPDLALKECIEVMNREIKAVNDGNLDRLEGMLTAQAFALNAAFNKFSKMAVHASYMPQLDAYMRWALKAQSQCRVTVEAIAEIKYPKSATFIKQANIAGQQQVNNGEVNTATNTRARAHEKTINPTNELLTEAPSETLDTRGTGTTGGLDSDMEAVGVRNWTAQ